MPHINNREIELLRLTEISDLDGLASIIIKPDHYPKMTQQIQMKLEETTKKSKIRYSDHLTNLSHPPLFISAPLVACIDDNHQQCEILGEMLQDHGYNFLPIMNETEALPLLITMVPSIIFLDLLMPIVNGYELCAQIRRVSRRVCR